MEVILPAQNIQGFMGRARCHAGLLSGDGVADSVAAVSGKVGLGGRLVGWPKGRTAEASLPGTVEARRADVERLLFFLNKPHYSNHLSLSTESAKFFQNNACMFFWVGRWFVSLDQIVCVKVRLIFGEGYSPFRFPDSRELSVAGIRSTNP